MTEHRRPQEFFNIGGAGGGGKDGGGAGTEAPNNLRSKQIAKVVDLLSEGPIKGLVNGLKSIYLDGVAMQNANGTMNFSGASIQWVRGLPAQPIMNGFAAQQNEASVALQLKKNFPIVRPILNTDADRCRVTVSTPSLQVIDKDTGDINGSTVQFRIECQNDGGGYKKIGDFTITGKTNNNYQRSIMFMLPAGGPWDIRLSRLTADSTVAELQNDLFWDSYTEIIDDRVNYSNSACVGVIIDAEQFRSIPKRVYHMDGIIMLVPSNYTDNITRATYSGVWDGNFKHGWTCNPAWILLDLVNNNRYGLGQYMPLPMIDKWSLYKAAQWCDQLVDDGNGGLERRWMCHAQITDQSEAFDLLAQICSVLRGFMYWSGGQMVAVADQPSDPVQQFTNANVIDGVFSYSGSDIKARHTMASVAWNDPEQLGEARFAVVEDQDAISRFGIQQVQVATMGCTSESQAIRTGKWTLFTEQYEAETVTFSTGLGGAWAKPGNIFQVADVTIAGKRYGGRVGAGSTDTTVNFDSPVPVIAGQSYLLSCTLGEGVIQTRPTGVVAVTGDAASLTVATPFTSAPQPDTTFVVTDPGGPGLQGLEPTKWRMLGGKQTESDQYEIIGIRHLPQKWDVIEKNKALTLPDVTDIVARPPPVKSISHIEYLVLTSPISVGVRVTLTWISPAPLFDIYMRPANGNWGRMRTDAQAIDIPVTEGPWEFQVTPIGTLGIKGPVSNYNVTIIGKTAPPKAPTQFRLNVVDGVAMFDWKPSTELDVIIGGHFELRHSSATSGTTWNTAQTVVPTIPGSASSVESGYLPGTWMLRTFDSGGRPSATWAVILAGNPDSRYTQWVRICENPDFLGTKLNTEVQMPNDWLVIGATGGLIDAQLDPIDSWLAPAIDVLPGAATANPHGEYYFSNRIDAGGMFQVRFSADILAFPFNVAGDFFDDRLDFADTWINWDDQSADYAGKVTLYIRDTPDDPASPTAAWSDWRPFIAGEHFARAWEFRADLDAPIGQNIGVETLCILADLRNKIDAGQDVPYSAVITRVNFNIKFFTVPAVVITLQLAMAEDRVEIVSKTREYFEVRITQTSTGTNPVGARDFDWHAQGY